MTGRQPPALLRRMLLTMVGAVLLLFVVIFILITHQGLKRDSGELDLALLRVAQSLARALEGMRSDEHAAEALDMYRALIQDSAAHDPSGEPPPEIHVARRDGSLRVPPQPDPDADPLVLPDGVSHLERAGGAVRAYTAASPRWKVTVLDDNSRRTRWVLRDVAADLLFYMALTLPMMLLPMWLAIRAALAPLRRLSDQVAARAPGDISPLALPRAYRELLPLQTALNRLFERVAATFEREKAFVHDAAHELRTPLAVISTQAHVLQASEGTARDEAARRLQAAVARASHLAQQLLRLAQAEAATLAPRQRVDAMNVVRDTLAGLAEAAAEHGAELTLDGPDRAPMATDPRALRALLNNLVDNALRYGGRGVQVAVTVTLHEHRWLLQVDDDGPGIPPEHRARVFERFWRGRAEDERGAGLGLAIVREAARALGGEVTLQAGPGGRGCRFAVSLPLEKEATVQETPR